MFAAILSLTALTSSASGAWHGATQPAQETQVPPGQWVVDYGTKRCSLARRTGGAGSPVVVLSSLYGVDQPSLYVLEADDPALDGIPDRVSVKVDGVVVSEETRVTRQRAVTGRVLRFSDPGTSLLPRFGGASRMTIEAEGRSFLTLSLPGSAAAVDALRVCNEDLLQSWGIDVAARRALTRQPDRSPNFRAHDSSDYPSEAIRAGEQGEVVIRVDVDARGRSTACRVLASSGSTALDERSCQVSMRRGRFIPALDANGQPVAAPWIYTIRWMLPE